jgi:RimJ/RimL family protein N-acetyltransferase
MTFAATSDTALIKATITHPRLYKWLCRAVPAELFEPPTDSLYVTVHDGAEYLGLFVLQPYYDAYTWEIHTALLPNAWGRSLPIYREGIAWTWANTGRDRIIGRIRETNPLAIRLAKRAGLRQIGRQEIAGESHYRVELEIRK